MPHRSMSSAGLRLSYLIVAGILCAAGALVGASALAENGPRELSLRELASQGAVLMSCADEGGASGALLWCADPDSPHCIPALPEAPSTELAQHGPLAVLQALSADVRAGVGRLVAWPEPRACALAPSLFAQRLERPPKHA
jgi:hypothetical protein